MPDSIIQLANEFRAAILQRERKAAMRMVNAYEIVLTRILKNLSSLNAQIREAEAKGETINPAWLFRQKRYTDLLRQVDQELSRFAGYADRTITTQQSAASKAGLSHSAILAETAIETAGISATFNTLPVAAVENMAGFLSNGAPLKSLLDQLP